MIRELERIPGGQRSGTHGACISLTSQRTLMGIKSALLTLVSGTVCLFTSSAAFCGAFYLWNTRLGSPFPA